MKLLRRDESSGRLTFRFERPEREMFTRILEMFPRQHSSLRKISEDAHAQELLEKALQQHRAQLREEASRVLRNHGELVIDPEFNEFWDLTLSEAEIEWTLQMLNDVRIGFWTEIGSPNPTHDVKIQGAPSDEVVRAHVIMQLCATWQGILIQSADEDTPG